MKPKFPANKIIIFISLIFLGLTLFTTSCSVIKGLFSKEQDEVTGGNVEELRLRYIDGDLSALEDLIKIYEDESQDQKIRLTAVRAIGESRHPRALESLTKYVETAESLDLDLIIASIHVLREFQYDPVARQALITSINTVDEKLRSLQVVLFKSLKDVQPEGIVMALLDIYERSRTTFYNTALMVSNIMAEMDEDEVIPILVFIANDRSLNIEIRNKAIEILAQKKGKPEVVDMFVEMLTNPTTENQIREFALRTMHDIKEERLILTLLETYNQGQESYYSLLNTLLDALGEFDDPAIISTLVEMATTDDIPPHLRIKAMINLGNFEDPSLFEPIIVLLEVPENYIYYSTVTELAEKLGVTEMYKNELNDAALLAQQKALGEKETEKIINE
tara:strand:- start:7183 stop:8358 length:1176 start_codon:yes stop_codon:yes gene_type:complete